MAILFSNIKKKAIEIKLYGLILFSQHIYKQVNKLFSLQSIRESLERLVSQLYCMLNYAAEQAAEVSARAWWSWCGALEFDWMASV